MDAWLSDKKTIQRSKRYYAHFDVRTDIGRMKDYVSNPKAVAAHGFYPFIHYEMDMSKFKRGKGVVPKKRDICYAAHIDRCIYQYYSHILNEKYNERTTCDGISNVAVAYRTKLGKSNIQFSKAAYDFIHKTENVSSDNGNIADTYNSDEDTVQDSKLIRFLDAYDYKEKLDILTSMRSELNDGLIDIMAESIEVAVPEGDITDRYNSLRKCLLAHTKYEGLRLRQ